ncbi:hypothetical protein CPAV1605_1341 [seawater metagenome]|uniref:Uncharacterized protein n=1 Tax=seawater metagenome TaxID=1561972 RepID=A0A5E8CL68_9ZZZZ
MDFKFALTGEKSNTPQEEILEDLAEEVVSTPVIQADNAEKNSETVDKDLETEKESLKSDTTNMSHDKNQSDSGGRGGNGRGRSNSSGGRGNYSGGGRGNSSGGRGNYSSGGRGNYSGGGRGNYSGGGNSNYSGGGRGNYSSGGRGNYSSGGRSNYSSGGRGNSSGGRGRGGFHNGNTNSKPKVKRSEEYWDTFRKAQDILFKECIMTDDDLEQAAINAQYLTDYRGETKWIKILNDNHDTIKTGVDSPDMQFQKSKLLTSRSFRKRLEEYYHEKAPDMYLKIFQSYKNNDICIKLVPRRY